MLSLNLFYKLLVYVKVKFVKHSSFKIQYFIVHHNRYRDIDDIMFYYSDTLIKYHHDYHHQNLDEFHKIPIRAPVYFIKAFRIKIPSLRIRHG